MNNTGIRRAGGVDRMFCHVCGTKIEDGSLYCEACGAKQIGISEKQVDVSSNYPTATKEVSKKENEPKTTVPKKNKGKKTAIICVIAAAAVLIVGGIVTFFIIIGRNSSGSPVGAPSGRIRVLYGDGDYSESVINDLTLPKKVDGVKVKWSSDKPSLSFPSQTQPTKDRSFPAIIYYPQTSSFSPIIWQTVAEETIKIS